MRIAPGSLLIGLAVLAATACDPAPRPFDASAAFARLEEQVAMGPRVPGSAAHRACLEYLESTLTPLADRVTLHAFDDVCAIDSTRATFHNVVAVFAPGERRRVLFGAHWDSRPVADQDPDPTKRGDPVPGANDGASGVAVLLEVARALKARPPAVGVDLVFFDGEDCGTEEDVRSWGRGSQRFVADHPGYRPGYAVILDMVGRKGTRIPREANSVARSPALVDAIWALARAEGLTVLADSTGSPVMDDHIAFLAAGIPAADLIDLSDPAWHTVSDLPAGCSPDALAEVGRLVLALIDRAERAKPPAGFPP